MITIKDFMETVDYRITEGSDYLWDCFGHSAYTLDSWNGRHDDEGYTVTIVFDTVTQVVYQMEAWDYRREREYRWINPEFKSAFEKESEHRSISATESIDARHFIDLEIKEDMLAKARAIVLGEEYDTRITIPIDIPDAELLEYMKLAHEMDMKFNDFVEMALRNAIDNSVL
jgi:hypothetical protein